MPKSGKEILKLYLKNGYELVKKQGKGSHAKVRKKLLNGRVHTEIIPMHKELKKGMEQGLLKRFRNKD